MFTQNQIIYGLAYGSMLSILIPVAVGLITWRYQPKPLRWLVFGLIGYFCIFLLSALLIQWQVPNQFTEYLSSSNDIIFYSICFGSAVQHPATRRAIFVIGGLSLLSLIVGPLLLKYYSVDSASITMESVAVAIVVYLYLNELIKNPQAKSLWQVPLFWIAVAKLTVVVIGLPTAIFGDQLNKYDVSLSLKLLLFTYVLYILCHLAYAKGLWQSKKHVFPQ